MIFDCFMYSGEESALLIRLHELDEIADHFVIAEGTKTFRGKDKPLYLDRVWDDIKPWHDRIHRVVVKHYPETEDPWVLEHFQRDQLRSGLDELMARHDDIVIVSDADEIPRASAVKGVNLWNGPAHLDMNTYYFYIDWKVPDRWNQGGRPFVALYEQMGSPQEMRDDQKRIVLNGAWHFSYLGGCVNVRNKIQSFAHYEYDTDQFTDYDHILECAKGGRDPFDRFWLEPVELDDTYPTWVQENRGNLPHLFRD